jgi:hypothetical protein
MVPKTELEKLACSYALTVNMYEKHQQRWDQVKEVTKNAARQKWYSRNAQLMEATRNASHELLTEALRYGNTMGILRG